jgi:hypothetical protein
MKIVRPAGNSSSGMMGGANSLDQPAGASPGKSATFRRQLPRRSLSQRFDRIRVDLSDDDLELESDGSQL